MPPTTLPTDPRHRPTRHPVLAAGAVLLATVAAAPPPAAHAVSPRAVTTTVTSAGDAGPEPTPARRTPRFHPAAPSPSPPRGGSGAFLHTTTPSYADIDRAPYVVLQQHQHAMIPSIRAARPDVRIYFYSNASAASAAAGSGSFQPSVITYPQLQAHPEWVLTDAHGTPTRWRDHPYLRPFDLGNPAVHEQAVANLTAEIAAHGWDGVMLDDVDADLEGHAWTAPPASYTGGSTFAATSAFVDAVAPAVHAAGKDVVVNMQTRWDAWRPQVDAWAPKVTTVNLEHCSTWTEEATKAGSLFIGGPDAGWRLEEMARIQSLGTGVWCHDYTGSADVRAQAYGRALFLMAWDGTSRSATMTTPAGATKSWYSPAAALDLGAPRGPVTRPAPNVLARAFARGTLYLSTSATPVTVHASGASFILGRYAVQVR